MERGAVVRVELPPPRGQPGREQFGERPAVVVQDPSKCGDLATVVVVPLTSNLASLRFTGSLKIEPRRENGLDVPSIALAGQVRAIDRRRVKRVIGQLAPEDLASLDEKLRVVLGMA